MHGNLVMYYIESKKPSNKNWNRHVPGFAYEDTAYKAIREWEFHGTIDREREYRVVRHENLKARR